jgi:glycosyltransferase involved in cell wall biosynthesis
VKLLIHDYPGHAFPVQLARALAGNGHEVIFVWSNTFQGPKGPVALRPGDPPGLRFVPIDLDRPVAKYNFLRRFMQERALGRMLVALIEREHPDVVIGNGPLDILWPARQACTRVGARYVYWLQDFYGIAIDKVLRRKLPGPGHLVGAWYRSIERRLLATSDWVVTITEDFRPLLERMGVARERTTIVENWAPLDEIAHPPRDNAWARAHGLAPDADSGPDASTAGPVFLYSGTLGLKHDPGLLLALARHLRAQGGRMVVITEGIGADWLAARGRDEPGLLLLPFQPHARFSEVLAAADVLVAILEADAGVFSVPSKILAYLCAGRPLLLSIPPDNLAARIVARSGGGLAIAAGDTPGFLAAAERLASDPDLRAGMGWKALDYAQRTFDIHAIAARFEDVLARATANPARLVASGPPKEGRA